MFGYRKHSIASRLVVWVVSLSTAVAVFTTFLQLYLDYQQELAGISSFFRSLGDTSIRPLEESVWILDDLQVNLQLEGLIKRQDIVYAAVEMDGQVAWAKGVPAVSAASVLVHRLPLHRHFRSERQELIGQLQVVASLEGVYSRLWRRVLVILASNALKTFLVAGLVLLIFQKALARHLLRLADHVRLLDIRKELPPPLVLERRHTLPPDELDEVVAAFNAVGESGHRAFAGLRTQEERLRMFLDATGEAVFGIDTQGACTFVNQIGLRCLAPLPLEEIIGQDFQGLLAEQFLADRQLAVFMAQVRRTMGEMRALSSDELQLRRRDDSNLTLLLRTHPVIDSGRCTGILLFLVDVTTQHQLEQEKQLFAKAIRQTPALVAIANASGLIEYVNPSFEEVLGRHKEALVGTRLLDMLLPLGISGQLEMLRHALVALEQWTGRLDGVSLSGRRIVLDAVISPAANAEGHLTHIVAVARDVTQEAELTRQLHHAQKMEAVGKLASSIAHEFGNPLLGIRFALRDVQKRPELRAEDLKLLQLAEHECDRMRTLIRDMQQFNRPSTGKRSLVELHRILDEILVFHRKFLASRKIELVRDYERQPVTLTAVEDQLRQVFVNLIINAGDAMAPAGGVLTVTTTVEAEQVVVTIGDTGPGVRAEHLERIFEPFFTTKSAVEGTGLGLPVSYGIVRAHGGTIEVQSAPGRTVFTVRLPRVGATAGPQA